MSRRDHRPPQGPEGYIPMKTLLSAAFAASLLLPVAAQADALPPPPGAPGTVAYNEWLGRNSPTRC